MGTSNLKLLQSPRWVSLWKDVGAFWGAFGVLMIADKGAQLT